MYKLHLILKYLRKRRIAWVSLVAVMLCTTMVLVVISVMGGWLRMFRESFHGLSGDVIVSGRSPMGFPHYQEMMDRLKGVPEVQATAPLIRTFGLVNFASTNHAVDAVQVLAFPIGQMGQVNEFAKSLYRQYQLPREPREQAEAHADDLALASSPTQPSSGAPSFDLLPFIDYPRAFLMAYPKASDALAQGAGKYPGMIVGAGLVGIRKGPDGDVVGRTGLMYRVPAQLTVLDINSAIGGKRNLDVQPQTKRYYWIVDDSRTKVWQYDSNTVYVPFGVLQSDLGMAGDEGSPARTTEIHVKVKDGVNLLAARDRINQLAHQVLRDHGYVFRVDSGDPSLYSDDPLVVQTWEQSQSKWLGAVEHEKQLVTFLFGLISIVAIFLIFCIFYMIVVEKTKDIGIIKSVGATSSGVAGIFLGYGLMIGVVGSFLGLLASYLIVSNINTLHTWMGRVMGVTVWDPEVYAFDVIPNTMNPTEVTWIMVIAVIASVLGALVPAIRAARMHPVEALRWE